MPSAGRPPHHEFGMSAFEDKRTCGPGPGMSPCDLERTSDHLVQPTWALERLKAVSMPLAGYRQGARDQLLLTPSDVPTT
jgi:hypothetical protein